MTCMTLGYYRVGACARPSQGILAPSHWVMALKPHFSMGPDKKKVAPIVF